MQLRIIQGNFFRHSKTESFDTAWRKSSSNLDSSTNIGTQVPPPLRKESADSYSCQKSDYGNKEYHFTDKSPEEQKIKYHYPNFQSRCNIKRSTSAIAPNSPRSQCSDIS